MEVTQQENGGVAWVYSRQSDEGHGGQMEVNGQIVRRVYWRQSQASKVGWIPTL
jgi:hypothetical protein